MAQNEPELEWFDKSGFDLRGNRFITDLSWKGRRESDKDAFTIVKNQTYFDVYKDLLVENPKSIFEVGFFEGGSSVFLDLYFQPDSLTCVDRRQDEIEAVEAYIKDNNRTDNFRMGYGIDQGDVKTLQNLAAKHHDSKLDLVIDDASHQYELTKATFSALFPLVKPGGYYVIEDYGWAHDSRYQAKDHVWAGNPSMTNLIFELTMVAAGSNEFITSIYTNRAVSIIQRGPGKANGLFDPSQEYIARGNKLTLV